MSKEIKIGIAALLTVTAAILLYHFGDRIHLFGKPFTLTMQFGDAKQLLPGNNVILHGHKVGTVISVTQLGSNGKIEVVVELQHGTQIPADSKAVITSGIVGSMFVRIDPGVSPQWASAGGSLEGAVEPSIQERVSNELLPLTQKFKNIWTQYKPVSKFIGEMTDTVTRGQVNEILADLKVSRDNYNTAYASFAESKERYDEGLTTVHTIVNNFKANDSVLQRLSENMTEFTNSLAYSGYSIRIIALEAVKTLNKLKDLGRHFTRTDNTAGKLINDTTFRKNLSALKSHIASFKAPPDAALPLKLKNQFRLGENEPRKDRKAREDDKPSNPSK